MLGIEEYMNSDENSVSSVETYYSQEAVSSEQEVYEEEEYYEEDHFIEEVPYPTKPVVIENPLRHVNTKVPEINPWSKLKQEEKNNETPKSFLEILEEEELIKEEIQRKAQEDEKKKARFQRRKILKFKTKEKPTESLLLRKGSLGQPQKKSLFERSTLHKNF